MLNILIQLYNKYFYPLFVDYSKYEEAIKSRQASRLLKMEELCQFLNITLGLVFRDNVVAIKDVIANYEIFDFIKMYYTP